MKLQACQNCWFNGLQYGSVGLTRGYCARHLKVLNLPDETTCGQQVRKDLVLDRALELHRYHRDRFQVTKIVRISNKNTFSSDASTSPEDVDVLREDAVADAVLDYGMLETKIGAIAQLKRLGTARSDIAMSSLGRAYTANCIRRGGKWTSGIHIYAWTMNGIGQVPQIFPEDFRSSGSLGIKQQAELSKWSVMMLKLYLLDDIVAYARRDGDVLGSVESIADFAAESVRTFDVLKLSKWIVRELKPLLNSKFDRTRYEMITNQLRAAAEAASLETEADNDLAPRM